MTGPRRRRGGAPPGPRRRALPSALTGTPGVGKSAVARALSARWKVAEVGELATRLGAGRPGRDGLTVDLARLRRALRGGRRYGGVDLVVGHLAHLLPVREAIVLRCRPVELAVRLGRARRGVAKDRRENFTAEALDVVLAEAVGRGLPVYEIDTTGLSVPRVARAVDQRLRRGGPPRWGIVDWLADPEVTEHLLEAAR